MHKTVRLSLTAALAILCAVMVYYSLDPLFALAGFETQSDGFFFFMKTAAKVGLSLTVFFGVIGLFGTTKIDARE